MDLSKHHSKPHCDVDFCIGYYTTSSWKMSLSYGYGGALTGLGVVGLCACKAPFTSRCLLTAVLQICCLREMGKLSTLVTLAPRMMEYQLKQFPGRAISRKRLAICLGRSGHRTLYRTVSGGRSVVRASKIEPHSNQYGLT